MNDDWFEWNGIRCTNYGMHVLSPPSIVRPTERVEHQTIPGRAGTLTYIEADHVYDDSVLACTCIIDDTEDSRIEKICGWLTGSGSIVFATRPSGFYKGRVSNQITFDKVVRGNPHVSFQVQFRCEPFFYLNSGLNTVTVSGSGRSITNLGNVPSQPLLRVTGSGEGTIMCGGVAMLVDLTGLAYLMIDCEAKIAYKGASGTPGDPLILLGTRVSGDWLTIPTGSPNFSLTGGISSVVVTPRWRAI